MYVDAVWVAELFVIVAFTAFSLYTTYLLPLQYGDLLHRSAVHLGTWERIDVPPSVTPKGPAVESGYCDYPEY